MLASDLLLRLGYVGSKATHLMMGYDQNAPIYDFSKTLQQNQATTDQRRPRSEYRLTSAGRKALNRYLEHIEAVIKATRRE